MVAVSVSGNHFALELFYQSCKTEQHMAPTSKVMLRENNLCPCMVWWFGWCHAAPAGIPAWTRSLLDEPLWSGTVEWMTKRSINPSVRIVKKNNKKTQKTKLDNGENSSEH